TVPGDYILRHMIVVDGSRFIDDFDSICSKLPNGLTYNFLPDNTGAGGWNGHKIYAHFAQLLDTDYLFLLDEDNTFDPNHIASLLPIAEKHGFAWSMRKVYTKSGE